MCRNITTLRGLQPQASPEEIEAAARQYVRKVSGVQTVSARTEAAVDLAVRKVAEATTELLAGLPPRQLYVHSDGASWDFMLIQPAETPPDKAAALDAAWEKLGLPTGADFFLSFRQYIASHEDTFVLGPTTAADYLASRKSKKK